MPDNVAKRWTSLSSELKGASLKKQLLEVNKFFNQWPYRTDMVVWGVEDYWATPEEFMKKSGDCEDYAIAKYYALRSLGVSEEIMRIVAVTDTIRGIGHAILAVYADDTAYILDNLSSNVLDHTYLSHYKPHFSLNEKFLWGHAQIIKKGKKK